TSVSAVRFASIAAAIAAHVSIGRSDGGRASSGGSGATGSGGGGAGSASAANGSGASTGLTGTPIVPVARAIDEPGLRWDRAISDGAGPARKGKGVVARAV